MKLLRNIVYKRLFFLSLLFMIFGLTVGSVSAHSPSTMDLIYSSEEMSLQVDITHQVSDPTSHYVNNVVVTVNDDTIVDQTYSSQNGSSFSYTYDIQATEGDTISVTAICNIGGSITEQVTVSADDVSSTDDNGQTPGFELVFLCFAIFILLIMQRNKRT